jgi:hypothetical protein
MRILSSLTGFKPLHSGAFLLTRRRAPRLRPHPHVSNPFIAGHSFLRLVGWTTVSCSSGFKPLHSGAFLLTFPDNCSHHRMALVSNPFIAGHSFLPSK